LRNLIEEETATTKEPTMSKSIDAEDGPMGEFDETNGLAGNLEGDDGGAESQGNDDSALGGLFTNALDPDGEHGDDTGETSYSEEGRA
jgi:hypothetical protein